ncbi:hypothetical protein [uncultured Streptomyces sp.]|uniref:hypothetical protein n=1 Tax=uncultured Streptomyces sp. TaxID=174707 RepID=UPI00260990F7|nr:hypothetical protein [uncultured Streptomyces sp.]
MRGDLDGAADALGDVWEVPDDQRATGLLARTRQLRRALTASQYRDAPLAGEIGERLEHFARTAQLQRGSGVLAALEA